MSKDTESRVERIEQALERDVKRLTELYDEINEIFKRGYLLGVELGAMQTALGMRKGEVADADAKDA